MNELEDDKPSKTQLKKDADKLQDLGTALSKLPLTVLETFDLPSNLIDAIKTKQSIKQNRALKRQMQFIGKVMRQIDVDEIQKSYDRYFRQKDHVKKEFHEQEQWRDKFIANDRTAFNDFLGQYPNTDRQQLRQLQRNAIKEKEQKKSPKSARILFQFIKETFESQALDEE